MQIEGLAEETRDAFVEIARSLGQTPDAVLARMVEHVVKVDREVKAFGWKGIGYSIKGEPDPSSISDWATDTIAGDIRETSVMWPADKPFPWSDAHCAAAVRGYQVRWPGSFEEFDLLRGKWELVDGYAVLHQV